MKAPSIALLVLLLSGCEPQFVDAVGVAVESDAGTDAEPPPQPSPSLLHRYSFDGMGDVARDERGAAHGAVIGTMLSGAGSLALARLANEQYVDLPNGIVSGLSSATIEVWVVWDDAAGPFWQRVFDFGNTDLGENVRGGGTRYMFLTAKADSGALRLVYSLNGFAFETDIEGDGPLPGMASTHLAVVVDERPTMALYLNGIQVGDTTPIPGGLSDIDDVNNWLGRSNFANDSGFVGTFYEFRIYDSAMSADEVLESYAAGPDAVIE
jgi:Concanavalin A-like lectin/glucanases superfamily